MCDDCSHLCMLTWHNVCTTCELKFKPVFTHTRHYLQAQCIEGRVLVWRTSGHLVSVSSLLHHMTAQQQLGHRSSSANAMQSFKTLKQYACKLPVLAFSEFADCAAQSLAKHSRSAQQRGKDSTEHHDRYRGHLSSQSDHKNLTPPTRRLLQSQTVTQSPTASSMPAKQPSNNSSVMSSPQPAIQSQVSQQNSSKNSTAGFVVTWPALPRRSPNPPTPGPETKHAPSKSGKPLALGGSVANGLIRDRGGNLLAKIIILTPPKNGNPQLWAARGSVALVL